jgi:DNA-binding NarL/FixJ family response regulator
MIDAMEHGSPETGAVKPARAFLIVDDESAVARSLARLLETVRPCTLAHTVSTALSRLEANVKWCGFVIDLRLGSGDGFDVLEAARRRHPRIPALMLTGYDDRAALNRAYALGAGFVMKPIGGAELRRFVAEALGSEMDLGPTLQKTASIATVHFGLTPAETEVLVLALRHEPVERILARRDVTLNTHKAQVRTLLEKMNATSMREACWRALALNRPGSDPGDVPSSGSE